MGINYRKLKTHGESIELERRESIITETSNNNFITRKKTILRERFIPKEKGNTTGVSAQQEQLLKELNLQIEETGSKPNLVAVVESASLLLKQLAEDIDNEISKLKEERDLMMSNKRKPSKVKKNAAIQNDMTWGQNLNADVEFTVEKFSSQHKFVCTSPRYARDEQTSCRPRMRTIGLQKNTNRSSNCNDTTTTKCSAGVNTQGKYYKQSFPVEYCCFDYGNAGDAGHNKVNSFHLQTSQNSGRHKVFQRYNLSGNYNGVVCNQNSYHESGVSPCNEYNYCRDEFHYDYPNGCHGSVSPAPYCKMSCDGYCNCCRRKPKSTHGRRNTDLNTDDFFYVTSGSPKKHTARSPPQHKYKEEKITTKKYMLAMADRQKQIEIEEQAKVRKDVAAAAEVKRESKRDSKKPRVSKQLQEELREKLRKMSSDKIARLLARAGDDSDESDKSSSLREYKVKSKEKLLKITLKKQKQRVTSLESDYNFDDGDNSGMEYSLETKRALKKMYITSYKPSKPQSINEDEVSRQKKERFKKDEVGRGARNEDEIVKGEKYSKYTDKYEQKPELSESSEREQNEISRKKDRQIQTSKPEDKDKLMDAHDSKTYTNLTAEPAPGKTARHPEDVLAQNISQESRRDTDAIDAQYKISQRRENLQPIIEDITAVPTDTTMKTKLKPQILTRDGTRTSVDSSSGKTDSSRVYKQENVSSREGKTKEGYTPISLKEVEDASTEGYSLRAESEGLDQKYSSGARQAVATADSSTEDYIPRKQRDATDQEYSRSPGPSGKAFTSAKMPSDEHLQTSRVYPQPSKEYSESYKEYPLTTIDDMPKPTTTIDTDGTPYVPRAQQDKPIESSYISKTQQREPLTGADGGTYAPLSQREQLPGADSETYVPRAQRDKPFASSYIPMPQQREQLPHTDDRPYVPSPQREVAFNEDCEKYRRNPCAPEPYPQPCGTPRSCRSLPPIAEQRPCITPRPYDSALRLRESPRLGATEAAKRPCESPRQLESPLSSSTPNPYRQSTARSAPCSPRPCRSPCSNGSPRLQPSTPQYMPSMRRSTGIDTVGSSRDISQCFSIADYESAIEEVENEYPPYTPQRKVKYRQNTSEENSMPRNYNYQEQNKHSSRNVYENDVDYYCTTEDERMSSCYNAISTLKLAQHWNASSGSHTHHRKFKGNDLKSRRVPDFTGCPCMFQTYLDLVALYCNDGQIQPNARKTINRS